MRLLIACMLLSVSASTIASTQTEIGEVCKALMPLAESVAESREKGISYEIVRSSIVLASDSPDVRSAFIHVVDTVYPTSVNPADAGVFFNLHCLRKLGFFTARQ